MNIDDLQNKVSVPINALQLAESEKQITSNQKRKLSEDNLLSIQYKDQKRHSTQPDGLKIDQEDKVPRFSMRHRMNKIIPLEVQGKTPNKDSTNKHFFGAKFCPINIKDINIAKNIPSNLSRSRGEGTPEIPPSSEIIRNNSLEKLSHFGSPLRSNHSLEASYAFDPADNRLVYI